MNSPSKAPIHIHSDEALSQVSETIYHREENILWKTTFFLAVIAASTVVTIIGVFSWPFLLVILPGYLPVLGIFIFLTGYWYYFSGHGPPDRWKPIRDRFTRSKALDKAVIKDSIIVTVLFVAAIQASFMVTFRIIEFPADTITKAYNFDDLPATQAWIYIVISAIVAGITEEVGFRGYAQVPLEDKFGGGFAVVVTSLFFMIVHLNQAWAPPIIFHIFVVGVLFALIARSTGSLLPGILAHSVLDIFNFSYWWSNILGEYSYQPIGRTGVDSHFVLWSVIFALSLGLLLWYLSHRNHDRPMTGY